MPADTARRPRLGSVPWLARPYPIALALAVGALVGSILVGPRIVRRVGDLAFLDRWNRSYPALAEGSGGQADTWSRTPDDVSLKLALAARRRGTAATRYDAAYVQLAYPGGDVPADTGTCADLVVRALRDVGIDLQAEVHRDMVGRFSAYPAARRADAPNASIDHRRVPNLMVYLGRHARALPIASDGASYRPGEIIVWHMGLGWTHIGIVTDRRDPGSGHPLVAHHRSGPPAVEDVLFAWPIVARFAAPAPKASRGGSHKIPRTGYVAIIPAP